MKKRNWIPLIALLVLSTMSAVAGATTWEHTRAGWMIGLSLGGGSAKGDFETDDQVVVSSDRVGGVGLGFRGGYAVRPDLVFGLEGNGWARTEEETLPFVGNVDVTTTLSLGVVSLTWYPGEGGFFSRGGLGWASLSQEIESGGITVTYDNSGFGVHGALGYEWRLTSRFALGPQVDLAWLDIGEVDLEDENGNTTQADVTFSYVTLSVLTNWYF